MQKIQFQTFFQEIQSWAAPPNADRYKQYSNITCNYHLQWKNFFQPAPFLYAITDTSLASFLLSTRCQLGTLPSHNPTLPVDPRRCSCFCSAYKPYSQRYCRLCVPHPTTWNSYVAPGLDSPLGNESHILLHCSHTDTDRIYFFSDIAHSLSQKISMCSPSVVHFFLGTGTNMSHARHQPTTNMEIISLPHQIMDPYYTECSAQTLEISLLLSLSCSEGFPLHHFLTLSLLSFSAVVHIPPYLTTSWEKGSLPSGMGVV